jgi:hypothetical protein
VVRLTVGAASVARAEFDEIDVTTTRPAIAKVNLQRVTARKE